MTQIIRGDSLTLTAKFTGVDLTGWKWAYTLKSMVDSDTADSAALLKFGPTAASAGEIAASEFSHTFGPAETNDLPVGFAYQDFQFENADGLISSIPTEKVQILGDVTRRIV